MDEKLDLSEKISKPRDSLKLPRREKRKKLIQIKDKPNRDVQVETKDETIARLREEVAKLEKKTKRMQSKLKQARKKWVASQNDSEAEFELRINRLLKQVSSPARSSRVSEDSVRMSRPILQFGNVSNTSLNIPLLPTLSASEDTDLENIYKTENIVSNLGLKLETVNKQKEDLEAELHTASTNFVQKLATVLEKQTTEKEASSKPNEVTSLGIMTENKREENKSDVVDTPVHQNDVQAVYEQNRALAALLSKFKAENFTLQQKIQRKSDEAILLREEKAQLEKNLEIASENSFNRARKYGKANSTGSLSSDSFSDSLSFVSTNPPSPSYQSARERKVFMQESNKMYAQRGETDLLPYDPDISNVTLSIPRGKSKLSQSKRSSKKNSTRLEKSKNLN